MRTSISCPICKSDRLVTDYESAEIICSNCGIVISDKIQDISNRSRAGTPSLAHHDIGLATVIGRTHIDARGKKITSSMRCIMDRLRIRDLRTQIKNYPDRSLTQAFYQLDKLKDELGLTDAAIEKTAYIYIKAQQRGFVRGRTITKVLSAAVYIACRELGISKTLRDVGEASNITRKELSRTYRLLITELDLKIPLADLVKCIAKVANKAGLREITKRQAINIVYEVIKKEISAGKDPMGLAASVLYLASLNTGERIVQGKIAREAGVIEATLRNRSKELKSKLQLN